MNRLTSAVKTARQTIKNMTLGQLITTAYLSATLMTIAVLPMAATANKLIDTTYGIIPGCLLLLLCALDTIATVLWLFMLFAYMLKNKSSKE